MRVSVLGLVLAAVVFFSGETTAYMLRSSEDTGINLLDTSSLQHHRGNELDLERSQPEAGAYSGYSGSRFTAGHQKFSLKKAFRKVKHALQSKAAAIVTKVVSTASKFIPVPGVRTVVNAAVQARNIVANTRRLRAASGRSRGHRSRGRRSRNRGRKSGKRSRGRRARY
ncbi:hypothetical protein LEN26_020493 [Aphanomyces euteiches]|nr:hypothetical protein LEN26_020493 [Aphanomyces euteiches]KAH9111472.1 hypothetical protein AeMF1_014017 [Aphanomyces euteiches]KAH9181580.1 hypothetical protein AeNC1_016444 [Aphanomyces euteiches]